MTQTYLSSKATTAPFVPREASAAGWLRSNAVTGKVDYLSYFTSGVRLVHRIPFEIDFFRRIE